MTEAENATFASVRPGTLPLPEEWVALAPHGSDPAAWAEEHLDGLGDALTAVERAELRFSLLTVMAFASGLRAGTRYNFGLIEEKAPTAVRALLSVQMLHVAPGAIDNYRDRLTELPDPEVTEVINRTVEDVTFHAGPAVILHDFTMSPTVEVVPDPALERCILGLFVDGSDAMIEFALYAQDLAVFENMVDYLGQIVRNLDFSGVSS